MSLIVKHKITKHGFDVHLFLRGVSASGEFYGEVRQQLTSEVAKDYVRANGQIWQGAFSEDDNAKFHLLANRLSSEFEFVASDLSSSMGIRTRVFSGKVGDPPNRQLAQVDNFGAAFPIGCGEIVEQILELLDNYAGPEYRLPIKK